jgi:hypothetical protein
MGRTSKRCTSNELPWSLAVESAFRIPSSFTRPSHHAPGQLAEFKYDQGGATIWVTVLFVYGQDEQTLHIERVVTEFGG